MENPLVKVENVSFRYPKSGVDALSGVSLEIPRGSFFALLGPNGAGKTTLLRLLCGRFAKFSGTIELAGDVRVSNTHSGAKGAAGSGSRGSFLDPLACGILLENPGVYPKLSINEYVDYFVGFYAARIPGWNEQAARERIARIAKSLELPPLDTRMGKLSLGNRQKVQLLRAMAPAPRLLILDEPVANLDPMSRETVWKLIADWRRQEGGTAIVCSHILAEMEEEATDFAIIDRGHVLKSGRVADIASETATFRVEVRGNAPAGNLSAGKTPVGNTPADNSPAFPTPEKIRDILAAAGIEADVNRAGTGLSSLYKKTVR
ncbi:ABC-2 type transport system ATP-binding protein/branched-chain amino acid transport system ATP-binding protein [Fibrobacter sp. UWR3]|uniref:ABC transporter ATP-binding protein n=1 Tax=Fibrobacter sp. UWR3 TaxID=1896217 RepID=UPI00092309F5|nr:ABC transporter ATP-binding protein [Fibrobacter sp. UWR3]SHM81987.1 ABC-2 type transport system ATP-binding protein/branched-chain amino acid transport system ATP-binding protein [Fibrobacter sp. UWR3]